MKKILVIVSFLCILLSSNAQDIENSTYIIYNFCRPTYTDAIADMEEMHDDKDLFIDSKRNGGSIALGGLYYINSLDFVDGLRLGINVEYFDLQYNYLSAKAYGVENDFTNLNDHETFADFRLRMTPKAGLAVSFSPMDIMKFDLYFRWSPMLGMWYYRNDDFFRTGEFNKDPQTNTELEYSLSRFGFGFNYRISIVYIGIEYQFGTTNTIYEDDDFPNTDLELAYKDSYLRLALGFQFDY